MVFGRVAPAGKINLLSFFMVLTNLVNYVRSEFVQ